MSLTFENVLDDALLLFLENWAAFHAWIHEQTGGGSGQVKLDLGMRQVTFLPRLVKRNEVVVPAHLAATVSQDEAVWAWAIPEYSGLPVSTMSARMREFGDSQHIATFTQPEQPIPSRGTAPGPENFALALGATGCRITGMPVAHLMPLNGRTAVLLLDPAGFYPPTPSREGFLGLIENGRTSGLMQDARRAVQGYAQARGLRYEWGPEFASIRLFFQVGEAQVTFDEKGEPHILI